MPLKIGRIGQHRKTGRAARLIGAGMGSGIEIRADQTLGWAGLFDLGNEGIAGGGLGPQSRFKAARGGLAGGTRIQIGHRGKGLSRRHFKAFGVADFGEFVGHNWRP